jgi:hypothetical protein
MEYSHNRTWLKLHPCSYTTWFLIRGNENRVVENCTTDFNQGKDNITLIYDDSFRKGSIPVKIPEKYCLLTQLLTEYKITIYEICENSPNIYETYYKALERIELECDCHKERVKPKVIWIFGFSRLRKTEFTRSTWSISIDDKR